MAVGMLRYMAASSRGMWVPPLKAAVTPASEPSTRTLRPAYAALM